MKKPVLIPPSFYEGQMRALRWGGKSVEVQWGKKTVIYVGIEFIKVFYCPDG